MLSAYGQQGVTTADAGAGTFRRVRHVLTENDRLLQTVELLGRAGPQAIGPLLHASCTSMRDDLRFPEPNWTLP